MWNREIKFFWDECFPGVFAGKRLSAARGSPSIKGAGSVDQHHTPSAMAQVIWYICVFIFVGCPWSATSVDLVAQPLINTQRNVQSFYLPIGAPRSGLSAPPLPGGSNIIPETNEEEDDNKVNDGPTVALRHGGALGSVKLSRWTKRPIYHFLGMPYAKAPIGDLRFKVS